MNIFNIGDIRYSVDHLGVVHQLDPQPFVYDPAYVSTYDKPEYRSKTERLSEIRWMGVIKHFQFTPGHVLDVGYGAGDFLKYCVANTSIIQSYGYDVTEMPLPEDVKPFDPTRYYHVVTFWDVLEHLPDPKAFVKSLNAKFIAISLPYCEAVSDAGTLNEYNIDITKFADWKHRKPNEHLHHFNEHSLAAFMATCGYRMLSFNFDEDQVRVSTKPKNILTAYFLNFNS